MCFFAIMSVAFDTNNTHSNIPHMSAFVYLRITFLCPPTTHTYLGWIDTRILKIRWPGSKIRHILLSKRPLARSLDIIKMMFHTSETHVYPLMERLMMWLWRSYYQPSRPPTVGRYQTQTRLTLCETAGRKDEIGNIIILIKSSFIKIRTVKFEISNWDEI